MGGTNSNDIKINDPNYFRSKTVSNESNPICGLPIEVLYYCIPLSNDIKYVHGVLQRVESTETVQSFTKKDFQIGAVRRMEEIVNATEDEAIKDEIGASRDKSEEEDDSDNPTDKLPFHNKYYFSLPDARNLMATCHAIRKKLKPYFKWHDYTILETALYGGWRNHGVWIDPNRVVIFFLYLETPRSQKRFTARRITVKDIFLSMGCSKNREKLSGNWKVVPRQGCNGVQLDYDPDDLERGSVYYKHKSNKAEWVPPEFIPMNFNAKTGTAKLMLLEKCTDLDYFGKLATAIRPTPFAFTDGVSQGLKSPLINGVPKSELTFVELMEMLEGMDFANPTIEDELVVGEQEEQNQEQEEKEENEESKEKKEENAG